MTTFLTPASRRDAGVSLYLGTRRPRPMACLADLGELSGPRRSAFDSAMPADHSMRRSSRKWWEWDYIADCAETLGLLNGRTTALGLGVGDEPLIFHFANGCAKVIASDLYSADTAWREARFEDAARVLDASPIPYPRDRVSVMNLDMRHTELPAGSVDLVWSCSSIEHVPTLADVFAVFSEIDRVLTVGGHAILTTEYDVLENTYLLPGVNAWNAEIAELVFSCLPGFEVVGGVDLAFNWRHPGNATRPRRYSLPFSALPGSAARFDPDRRAGALVNAAGLAMLAPIAFTLRKTSEAGVIGWAEAPVRPLLRRYTEGVQAFHAGDNDRAVALLEMVEADPSAGLQLRLFAFRHIIDARARRGEMRNRDALADRIEAFLRSVPAGSVQDADALDICAYLLSECGRTEAALAVFERCILSPSTSVFHVCQLAYRYLALAAKTPAFEAAGVLTAQIIADLRRFGTAAAEIEREFFAPAAAVLPETVVGDQRRRVRAILDAAAAPLLAD